jgi:hypothetical protein
MRSLGVTTAPDFAKLSQVAGMGETITYLQITLTVGADKRSTWLQNDAVRNDTGDGDDWTGTIAAITATTITVTLVTGTYSTINIADGIENTTHSDTTTVSAKASSNKYAYSPLFATRGKDLTAWHYSGGIGTSASILSKFGNIVGNWKITIEAGKPSIFQLTGAKGKFLSEAAATIVSPTKNRTVYPAALAWTVSVHGVTYKLVKMEIEGGNSIDQRIDGTEAYGYGSTEVTDKKGKFNLQIYADAALALPSVAGLASAVESAITLVYGPANGKLHFSIGYPQIQDWKKTSVGNLTAFDITGIMSQNNFVITTNNDLT